MWHIMRAGIPRNAIFPMKYKNDGMTSQLKLRYFTKIYIMAFFSIQAAVWELCHWMIFLFWEKKTGGILDKLHEPLKISLDDSFGIFSSGMGGYVTVDLSDYNNGKATLWFASRPPH